MSEETVALNTEGSPDSDGYPDFDNVDGSIEESAQEGSPDEALNTDKESAAETAKPHEEAIPYERFKEVNERVKDLDGKHAEAMRQVAQLEGQIRAMQTMGRTPPGEMRQAPQEQVDFKNIAAMTDEQVLDEFEKQPIAFLGNLVRQVRHETTQHIMNTLGKKNQEQGVKSTFENYAKENPDFIEMVQSGELKKFMDANPFHNAISAHSFLSAQKKVSGFESQKQQAIEEAVKKREADLIKQYQTKGKLSTTLGQTPAPKAKASPDDMLQNPDKYGGRENVLVERLRRFRTSRAA